MSSSSPRQVTRTRRAPRTTPQVAGAASSSSTQSGPSSSTGKISVFFKGIGRHDRAGQPDVPLEGATGGRRGCRRRRSTRSGTGLTPVSRSMSEPTTRSRQASRCVGSPRAVTRRRRSTRRVGGFGKNDGDNEITGAIVSNGDPGPDGILGAKNPNLGIESGAGSTRSSTVTTSRTRSSSARAASTATTTATTTEQVDGRWCRPARGGTIGRRSARESRAERARHRPHTVGRVGDDGVGE